MTGGLLVKEAVMDNWTFGWSLIVVGMGGTVAALKMFALMIGLLKTLFPMAATPPPGPGAASAKTAGAPQHTTDAPGEKAA
jgi:hypothetical protein